MKPDLKAEIRTWTRDQRLAIMREASRRRFAAYVTFVHQGAWEPGRLHKYLCDEAQDFAEAETGNPYEIMLLSVPPQHGKSQAITESLPSWWIGRHPDARVIVASYDDELAVRFGRRNKQKLEQYGEFLFGVKLSRKTADREFETAGRRGGMVSRGIMAGITGMPADLMIIDDPIKNRQDADSRVYRERLWDEWNNTLKTRLSANAKVIVIQTRWHEDDLFARIQKGERNVRVINIPCEAEEGDVLGREPGDALAPEIGKDRAWMDAFKGTCDKRAWNALYQGRPSSEEGNILMRDAWRRYRETPEEIEANADAVIVSVDCSYKGSDGSDNVAVQVWGKRYANLYLIDALARRMGFRETVSAVSGMCGKHPRVSAVYVEEAANGAAVIDTLRDYVPGLVGVKPEGGKVSRAYAAQGLLLGGNVYLPDADFADELVEECAAFPYGEHDDRTDAFTQAAAVLRRYASAPESERGAAFPFRTGEASGISAGKGDKIDVI